MGPARLASLAKSADSVPPPKPRLGSVVALPSPLEEALGEESGLGLGRIDPFSVGRSRLCGWDFDLLESLAIVEEASAKSVDPSM